MRLLQSVPASLLALFACTASALAKRESCGLWDTIPAGPYTIYQNLWGTQAASSGWQCSGLDYQSGDVVSWNTVWNWQGGPGSVKSYANVELKFNTRQLSSISSIPTTWRWSYAGSNIVADVSYDIFTSNSPSGSGAYEIMIWLAALGGAGPISSTGKPVATVEIAGTTWDLFKGPNTSWTVFSFVARTEQTSFNADLFDFFEYLIHNQGMPLTQYVSGIAAGTEPFSGSNAQLTTSEYVLSIH